jgi:murein DD-endopeptidase MepM/ murein hydrolase activator NlpD
LAIGTMPMSNPAVGAATHTRLSYELFMQLVQAGDALSGNGSTKSADQDADEANAAPGIETRTVTLDRGDTLAGAMEDAGVSSADANGAVAALGKDFDPRALKAGMTFDLTYSLAPTIDATGAKPPVPKTTVIIVNHKPVTVPVDANDAPGTVSPDDAQQITRLLSLEFSPTIDQDITVTRTTSGDFTASNVRKQLQVHHHRAGATIDSSLYLAGMQAGIPADVVVDMIRLFSYKVDFQRDLHPGDSFEVYYDYYYTPEGQPAKEGNVSYARMTLGGKDIILYRYQDDPNSPADYFDAKGQSAKGMLMKTPVDGARISSGFGMRLHPVLGFTRMHKGIDFAVPVGTPVMAAGTGTVKLAGVVSGYGNYMRLDLGNGYGVAYGHLSRFAPGVHVGSKVHQGQIVAYSGNTGLTTGPHLHYETLVNGQQVNPLTLKVAQGVLLSGRNLRDFLEQRLKIDAAIAATPLETKVADIATDLRQAKSK